jgi:hypothetical protein
LGRYSTPLTDPLDGIQVGTVPVASIDRVPLAGPVLEPPPPFRDVGAVLGVSGLVLDEPEASLRLEAEGLGVVVDGARLGRGSDRLATPDDPRLTWTFPR